MSLDQIIASSTDTIARAGTDIFKTIFGIFPTWLDYAIPLALLVGAVMWFVHRRGLAGGQR